jgi:HK97 family phage major capsid protein
MTQEEKALREEIGSLSDKMQGILDQAEDEDRSLTDEERNEFDDLQEQVEDKKQAIKDLERKQNAKNLKNELGKDAKDPNEMTEPDIEVKGNRAESEGAMYHNTAKIFQALAQKRKEPVKASKQIEEAQKELFVGGHYKGLGVQNSVEAFSTLTDSDGGIFLPTTISDEIMEIERQYGVFPSQSMRIPMEVGGGRQILPNMLGEITFHATNQGNEAKASRFTFSGLSLEEMKWMAFVPWTNEMGSAAGQRLVQLVMRKLGEGSARIKDDAAINADGTSTYHNLKGLLNRSNDSNFPEVRRTTAASGHTSFSDIDDEDLLNAKLDVAPSIRGRGIYVMHPDWDVRLRKIKDNDGQPLYRTSGEISLEDGQWFISGRPVYFTEKAPNTDGTSAAYAIFYVPDYFAFGDVGAFSTEELTEATIKDENDNDIRLASQDMRALRIKEFFDFELSQLTISSGGNDLGAFTVLETAAS